MHEIKELQRHVLRGRGERAVDSVAVVIVDAVVLVVEGAVEDAATEGRRCEHAFDEGSEFYVAVVKRGGDGAGELHLVGLEAVGLSVRVCAWERSGADRTSISLFYRPCRYPSYQLDGRPWD